MDKQFGDLHLSHIVAAAKHHVIGIDGALPWHIPEDFRLFKRVTMGHAMIMGRKTFESIGRPLPGRLSIVVTRNPNWSAPGVVTCTSVAEALAHCNSVREQWGNEVFIIGGGAIFTETLPLTDTIYFTDVDLEVKGDTYYPEIPSREFSVTHEEVGPGDIPFTWRVYKRQPSIG
ncbi:MAG: dihydrofolate reductase [Proteobacteria bacterium]|nr:dihydrofolate reductase [Pseudomonadota bacterium]